MDQAREKVHVRVVKEGKTVRRELMVNGLKVAELSFIETIELVMQAASSLRWESS